MFENPLKARIAHKKARGWPIFAACFLGLAPVLAVLWLALVFMSQATQQIQMPTDIEAYRSAGNSLIFAAIVAAFSTPLAAFISSYRNQQKIILSFCIILVFVPGQIVALGLQYVSSWIGIFDGVGGRALFLFLALSAFTLPFQIVVMLSALNKVEQSEWDAAQSFLSPINFLVYFCLRNKSVLISIFAVSFALAFAEGVRTSILGADFFGLGTKMFTPYISSKYNSGGFSEFFHFLSALIYVAAVCVLARGILARNA